MPVRARAPMVGAAGIRGQRLKSVERWHAGKCMTVSTGRVRATESDSQRRGGVKGVGPERK
jgi:hypothetical protein